jgi:hypothetical protein
MTGGEVAILNCTDGDTRISFDSANPEEVERAKAVVEDMLKRGYCIAVVVGDKMERVTGFDPEKSEYIVEKRVSALPPLPASEPIQDFPPSGAPEAPPPGRKAKGSKGRVPAKDAKAVAVGRTAGGGLGGHFFPVRLTDLQRGDQ